MKLKNLFQPNPDRAADRGVKVRLALRGVVGHVHLTRTEATAWYLLAPVTTAFRAHSELEEHISAGATTLAQLGKVRTHWRVTGRPFSVRDYAELTWRDATEHGQPLPCYPDVLEREQRRIESAGHLEKMAFCGVRIADRRLHPLDPRREVAALSERLEEVTDIMSGDGVNAEPATPAEMDLLLRRSIMLGLPAPQMDDMVHTDYELADLPELDDLAEATAPPWTKTVRMATTGPNGDRIERHVAVLTMGRVGDMDIPQDGHGGLWQRTDRLPFPVEWSSTVDVLDGAEVGSSLRGQMDVIQDQYSQYVDEHRVAPPEQLKRQHSDALAAEKELDDGLGGQATRTHSWNRLAVWGHTEREVLKKVAEVKKLYGRRVDWWHSTGQLALAREFIPGEPLANKDSRRRFTLPSLLTALPSATAQLGDGYGTVIGPTSGTSRNLVAINMWADMEERDRSGLLFDTGGLGSGKTTLNGAIVYRTVTAGVPWTVLDPSARMGALCELPELKPYARHINLAEGQSGELGFYRVVAEPERAHFETEQKWQSAVRAAATQRQDLARDVLLSFLPKQLRESEHAVSVLRRITRDVPGKINSSPLELFDALDLLIAQKTHSELTNNHRIVAGDIKEELASIADSDAGRVIFGEAPAEEDDTNVLLEVYSLANIMMPDERTMAAGAESSETRIALGLFELAAWRVSKRIYSGDPNQRKGLLFEEGHLFSQLPSGPALLAKTSVDTRKHNTRAILSSQNAQHFDLNQLANLAGMVAVGKTTDKSPGGAGETALKLLSKPLEERYLSTLATLSPESPKTRQGSRRQPVKIREFIIAMLDADGGGGVERVVSDLYAHPHVLDALNTTPGSKATPAPSLRAVEVA